MMSRKKRVKKRAVKGLAIGSGVGAIVALFGTWLATWNYAGVLFVLPGMLLVEAAGCGIDIDAGPSPFGLFAFWGITGNVMVGGGIGALIGSCLGAVRQRRQRSQIPGICFNCGYALTGNTSGRCPECGQPVDREW